MIYESCICVNTDKISTKNFPNYLKEYILEGIQNEEKVVIVTDSIYYKKLQGIFPKKFQYIRKNINIGNIIIKTYDADQYKFSEITGIVNNIVSSSNYKCRILWEFKNILKKTEAFKESMEYISTILKYSIDNNIKNVFYINNATNDKYTFDKFCKMFHGLIICDKGNELYFSGAKEIEKATYFLQSYAEVKKQNTNLVLFNKTMLDIPKDFHKDEFKSRIIDKLRQVCNIDFCIICTTLNSKENILSLDSCFGLTKKHNHFIENSNELVELKKQYNDYIFSTGNSVFIETSQLEEGILKEKLTEVGIISTIGVNVEYDSSIGGVIWVGRYKNNNVIFPDSIKYIESICRTLFYLIIEQERFFKLQNKFIENEKLRVVGEMSAGIAHDINNILTPVIGSVQILKDKYYHDPIIMKHLNTIEMCAYDATNIANKIRKLTKNYNNVYENEIFYVDEVLMDAVHLMENKWLAKSALNRVKINVITKLNSKDSVKGNSTELREVFINLISNAIDAMPLGGKIEVLSSSIDDYVIIEIRDNGLGMNEKIQNRIFEPFFTTKGEKGSGLGLSITYKIIQSYGGNIEIDSQENVGTSFKIKLPICSVKTDNMNIDNNDVDLCFDGNILVIDDKRNIRNIVGDMIKSICTCKVKKINGDSISKIEKELEKRKYDIVICDFSMPNINGIEVAELVKKMNFNTYFCLMTGWIGDFSEGHMQYINKIIYKPIDKEQIKEVLIEYDNR